MTSFIKMVWGFVVSMFAMLVPLIPDSVREDAAVARKRGHEGFAATLGAIRVAVFGGPRLLVMSLITVYGFAEALVLTVVLTTWAIVVALWNGLSWVRKTAMANYEKVRAAQAARAEKAAVVNAIAEANVAAAVNPPEAVVVQASVPVVEATQENPNIQALGLALATN